MYPTPSYEPWTHAEATVLGILIDSQSDDRNWLRTLNSVTTSEPRFFPIPAVCASTGISDWLPFFYRDPALFPQLRGERMVIGARNRFALLVRQRTLGIAHRNRLRFTRSGNSVENAYLLMSTLFRKAALLGRKIASIS
jgi:hypothetical protein